MFEIQKKVPVPRMLSGNRERARRKYDFEAMKKGDSFFVPNKSKNTMTTHVSSVGKKLGVKFASRLCYMRQTLNGWVPAEKGDKGAVLGIGVWHMGKADG